MRRTPPLNYTIFFPEAVNEIFSIPVRLKIGKMISVAYETVYSSVIKATHTLISLIKKFKV